MAEPKRLLEDGDDFERELLGSAESDIQPELEGKVLAAIGSGGGGGPVGGGGSAAASGLGGSKALWIVGSGIVLALGVWGVSRTDASATGPADPAPTPARVEVAPEHAQPTEPTPTPRESDERPPEKTATAIERKKPAQPPSAPARVAPAPSEKSNTLAEETAALDGVRKAIGGGSGAAALRGLDEYGRKYPKGMLRAEATVLRVRALLASGDRAGAEALGRRIVGQNPDGFYAKQIRELIGDAETD